MRNLSRNYDNGKKFAILDINLRSTLILQFVKTNPQFFLQNK
jgi:hypothetical protein